MAKQTGVNPIKGTIDNLTYYNANGQDLVKRKNSTNIDMVNGAGYELYKYSIGRFGRGSKLVKTIYWELPKERRKHGVFGKLTGMANEMLFKGVDEEEVVRKVREYLESYC